MKKLPRFWARAAILLDIAGIALAFFILLRGQLGLLWAGAALIAASFFVKHHFLRCPHCHKASAMPQWAGSGRYRCPCCGNLMEYD